MVTGTLKAEDKRGTKLRIVGTQTPSSLVKTHRTSYFHLYPVAQLLAWGSVLAAFPSPPCAGVRGFCTGLGTNQRMAQIRAAPSLENQLGVSKSVTGRGASVRSPGVGGDCPFEILQNVASRWDLASSCSRLNEQPFCLFCYL